MNRDHVIETIIRLLAALVLAISLGSFGRTASVIAQAPDEVGSSTVPAEEQEAQSLEDISISSQLGTAFTYQARLVDANIPANGNYDFEFRLYNTPSGGSQVGVTVTKDDIAVTGGQFAAELDFGSNVFNGSRRFLAIAVRPGTSTGSFTTLTPRQALTPTPYAIFADYATSLAASDGSPLQAVIVDNTGRVGIGSTSPREKLEVDGQLRLAADATTCAGSPWNCYGDIRHSGSGGMIINSRTGGTWADMHLQTNGTSRLFIESQGNVGVGTTSPREKFEVGGKMRLAADAATCAGSPWNCFGDIYHAGSGGLVINSHTGALWADTDLQTNGISRLFIESQGNVGIGTTNPRQKLEVNGTVWATLFQTIGGDLAESFDIADIESVTPGMVLSIDADQVGQLRLAEKAYDRTVAGVVGGAGGIKPGMILRQPGDETGQTYPVALAGRVYVWADAEYGAIQPGDLLTTSDTPGHAMKVTDHQRAQGAILGKAMSALPNGQGLVLVLVSLQ